MPEISPLTGRVAASIDPLNPLRIRSDGEDSYADGLAGVSVRSEDDYGWGVNFETSPFVSGKRLPPPPIRDVRLGFCELMVPGPLAGEVVAADLFAFLYKTFSGQTPTLRSMTLDQTAPRRFYLQWPRSNPEYRLEWNNAGLSGAVWVECQAVTTAAISSGCSKWMVKPEDPNGIPQWAELKTIVSQGQYETRSEGIIQMPFEMTLACKNVDCK